MKFNRGTTIPFCRCPGERRGAAHFSPTALHQRLVFPRSREVILPVWFWSCCRRSTSSLSCRGASCIPPPPGKAPSHTTTSQLLWMLRATKTIAIGGWQLGRPLGGDVSSWLSNVSCQRWLTHTCFRQLVQNCYLYSVFLNAVIHECGGRIWGFSLSEWIARCDCNLTLMHTTFVPSGEKIALNTG